MTRATPTRCSSPPPRLVVSCRRLASPGALLLLLLPLLVLGGCSEEDEGPIAEVRFLHSVDDLGALDVILDGEVVVTLNADELSQREEVPAGAATLALRSVGASSVLRQSAITLQPDQTHLIAFTGALSLDTLQIVVVDQLVPEDLSSGQAAVEVVNLLDNDIDLDIYVGGTLIISNPALGTVSPFVAVQSGTANLQVFNAGSDPTGDLPVFTSQLSLNNRGAVMLVMTTGPAGGLEVTTVPVR